MSNTILFIYCNPDIVGGITGGYNKLSLKFCGKIAILTDAQVRKIKPLEKKTKYSDEKDYIHDVIEIQLAHRVGNAVS